MCYSMAHFRLLFSSFLGRNAQNDTWYVLDTSGRSSCERERVFIFKTPKYFPFNVILEIEKINTSRAHEWDREKAKNPKKRSKITSTMEWSVCPKNRGQWKRSFGNKSISYANVSNKNISWAHSQNVVLISICLGWRLMGWFRYLRAAS